MGFHNFEGLSHFCPGTVRGCCALRDAGEPIGEFAVTSIVIQFLGAHAIEKLIQMDVLGSVYPLTGGIDPDISPYCANYDCCVDLNFAGSLFWVRRESRVNPVLAFH